MKTLPSNFFLDLFLARYKIYRYFLLFKLFQNYLPELQKNSGHVSTQIKDVIKKNMKDKPLPSLTVALIAGVILSRMIKYL